MDDKRAFFTPTAIIKHVVVAMFFVLAGCVTRNEKVAKADIQFVPANKTTQSIKVFRQQLMYCTTQYLAETKTSDATISWQLSDKKLNVRSPDAQLQRYLSVCAENSVFNMGNESDRGEMTVSGKPELAESQRM